MTAGGTTLVSWGRRLVELRSLESAVHRAAGRSIIDGDEQRVGWSLARASALAAEHIEAVDRLIPTVWNVDLDGHAAGWRERSDTLVAALAHEGIGGVAAVIAHVSDAYGELLALSNPVSAGPMRRVIGHLMEDYRRWLFDVGAAAMLDEGAAEVMKVVEMTDSFPSTHVGDLML